MTLLVKAAIRTLSNRVKDFENRLDANIKRAFDSEKGKEEFLQKYDKRLIREIDELFHKIFYIAITHHEIEERITGAIEILLEPENNNKFKNKYSNEYSDEDEEEE